MVTKSISFTDDGTIAYVQSEILIDGLPNKVIEVVYDYGTYKQTVRDALKEMYIHTEVSHEPFLGEAEQDLIASGTPVEAIINEQRFKDGEEFHIDAFGFYVYLRHSFSSTGHDTLDDTRFEKIKPPEL
jgi:hypothetical protein